MKLIKLFLSTVILLLINVTTVQAAEIPYSPPYSSTVSKSDVELLACVIHGESGADYCSNDMRYYVGSVVVNRLNCEQFPDTLEEVVYQEGQYGCVDGKYFKPDARCIHIAQDILVNGCKLPKDVVYQSNAKLGHGVYVKEQNMYFCYI